MPRGFPGVKDFMSAMEAVHLVEVSQPMRKKQGETLQCETMPSTIPDGACLTTPGSGTQVKSHHLPVSDWTVRSQIQWHSDMEEIPRTCPEFVIGHEFLDALPVHQFVKSQAREWRERMVDIAEDSDPLQLRFVLAPSITPAAAVFPKIRLSWMPASERDAITELEVGSDMLSLGSRLAERISQVGGATLLIDYGKNSPYPCSLQGIRKHQRVHALELPGETDVSAYVDFAALRHSIEESDCNAIAYGPIEQRYLLKELGIDERVNSLVPNATAMQYEQLKSGYERLIGSEETGQAEGMGKLYKAMVITQKGNSIPVGFEHGLRAL